MTDIDILFPQALFPETSARGFHPDHWSDFAGFSHIAAPTCGHPIHPSLH